MMITILGLSPKTKYQDVKLLIRQECNINDFILDNLIDDNDGTKKVRIGLSDDSEGYKVIKCLNGYRMSGIPLKVVPVGKAASNPNDQPSHGGYNSRPGFPNQPRNDNPNPARNDFMGQANPNDYRGPHGPHVSRGPGGPSGSIGPHGPTGPQRPGPGPRGPQGPMENMRPSPWATNTNNPNQWSPNPPMVAQVPQNSFSYGGVAQQNALPNFQQQMPGQPRRPYDQGRPGPLPAEQNFGGYPPNKYVAPRQQPDLRHNLRNIDTMEGGPGPDQGPAPPHGGRYPPSQQYLDKPVTIMKNNFQGPSQYNINNPGGQPPPFQQQPSGPPWQPQGYQNQPQKPFDDRKYPVDPKNMPPQPDSYKEYEKRRGFSPSDRRGDMRVSPRRQDIHREMGRRPSPSRMGDGPRRGSPIREDLGRRYSPTDKRGISPGVDRRMRDASPHKRLSPTRRLVSPGRRDDRGGPRFSPNRHRPDKMGDNYGPDSKDPKKVRPAYEQTSSHAPNQAMYSGGFRPSGHDNPQYSGQGGMRQDPPGPWQRPRDDPPAMKTLEEERREVRLQMARERALEMDEKRYSPSRKPRSPTRRDRSPIRERYKRNSPSPRSSYSPRRSWALEKRRSPDAPPPPEWPGADNEQPRKSRPNFPEKEEKPKHTPVWEPRSLQEDERRRLDERRNFEEAKLRLNKELMDRTPAGADNYRREPKFSPRDDFETRRDNFRRGDSRERKPNRPDFEIQRGTRPDDRLDEYNRRRESPRRDSRKEEPPKEFDKDIQDIYIRAQQFKKKAEELRESSSKKRDDFDDARRHENNREEIRQRFEDRHRYRSEDEIRSRERDERRDIEPRDDRSRDDRLRGDRPRDVRPRHDDERRDEFRPRDQHEKDNISHDEKHKRMHFFNPAYKMKRDKAVREIAAKIIDRSEEYRHVEGEQKYRIFEELKLAVARILFDMFGDGDVSYIEAIVKYQARYTAKDEAKILQEVMQSLPKPFRTIKRQAPETSEVPAKTSRLSPEPDVKQDYNLNIGPPGVVSMFMDLSQSSHMMNAGMVPMMVPAPFYQTFDNLQQTMQNQALVQAAFNCPQPVEPVESFPETLKQVEDLQMFVTEEDNSDGYWLYLCKDDSERITNMEANLLKEFLVAQMLQATEQFQGWSPDFTFKGLQSLCRYEVVTKDEGSRDWLMNLDFKSFEYFNVLVYSKEELWYERAAIWLPGHSRVKYIEPLDKLKLQNKKLEGVNVEKWKFVKKIVTEKGTRLYVDMPPSSARALEFHEMKLSYELQQVNVFLKAVAVDKDVFDNGLKARCLTSAAEIAHAVKNATMPVLSNDQSLVKLMLKGSKSLDLVQARKIKEIVIYNLFQYHQQNGISRTDFVKYGYLKPNFFGILPLNQESKRWLTACNFGKVNRQAVVIAGGEEDSIRYVKMNATLPQESTLRLTLVKERLKNSNQGVKGINFQMWRALRLKPVDKTRVRYEVEVDLESLETMSTMRYQLDYVTPKGTHIAYFRSDYSQSGLEELMKKYRAEMTDTYDDTNMDLESDETSSESNNGEVVCLD